ncbi:hypothetical protein HBH56_106600 [Parastagonospora nodorum]|uniref:DUF3431 domain containing protein n=2 Tax=Phaeosphaeria nodorum (strain SN15 / ATCC MYA-4574 / FGSC 10173) TaxID=321614 RepID=A0A7U2FGH3_PHANO|nr:hypothetical protein SNOG_10765 [Parastagonospora nodorum SN15]KAH3913704.1 hypothetical protein HBH56_106600 [Parastagonospora nodorum]EAT82159.1 hypothetical protein SNOG_10765 [Parastagonospora nodorum SN15]KAH3929469.1 hypothetical protein HBH54_123830 [Parastagonospora nodorum]KAH3951790.1 hypothetical protein HBH53_057830 [Parastagonospora nodorum]KAH3975619.1 hypothetical protein HBH52_129060 [Parastagonospora nodorum]
MPRFSVRNIVVTVNILLLTALVIHLKQVLWDRQLSPADLGTSHIPDELLDDAQFSKRRTAVVVAAQASENATWLDAYFPDWEKNIYRVDDASAALTVPKNKGRESMVYLTYIIDNYDSLADNVLFIHPNRYQWHNDDPDYDGLPMLRRFQLPYLEKQGYVNIRCAWSLGCPAEIKPFEEEGEHREAVHAGGDYKQAFEHLFPGTKVPETVGVSCCAQFAATREKIRERKKSEYVKYRQWIMDTDLKDSISGRVMEYSWHMIFGKPPVHCPSEKECYCKTFGLCNLTCNGDRDCQGRYTLPPFSSLPDGWPYVGWNREDRERAGPEDPFA